ncbi:hypothetical protein SARC_12350 [Sphaeroforma arctica JP610]|uniref:Uncharacterized protein n=1 Tax=Sphaeroforma arctica JP610 TaxID=667725 RepID=A0A0L0FEC8_9EUKA|nr:hypothetical protein SARC_12350 [Sphaeroforma arctica JP610]KNC75114.1 hypothetical protein SARC_12350 [Sphaeroforma arctica JP610]|eukprot:XP_014149016.1 hypothetical protein SARC_12350 [Sphaeroforma arctica JP610]
MRNGFCVPGFYFGIDGCEGLVPEATDIPGDRTSHINGKVIVKPRMGLAHEKQHADARQSEATNTSHNERDTLQNAQQAQALGTHTDEGTPNQATTSKESVRKTLGQRTMLNRPKKKTQTVQDYVQRNALAERWKRADWFRKCREKAINAIVQSPIESSPKVNARLVALLGHIWYDFDSLTPRGRISGGWEELITAIDTHTNEFVQCLVKAAEVVSASEANGQENIEHSAGTRWERAVDEATASMYARINQRTM